MAKSFSKKAKLLEEIEYEVAQLKRLANAVEEFLRAPQSERRPWDAAAAAKYVSDVCAGLENLCKRRSSYLGKPLPEGPDFHARVLQELLETPEFGGAMPEEFALRLKKYMRFRHRFIHGYGFEVSWAMVEEPLRLLPDTVKKLTAVWMAWAASLPDDVA